MPVNQDGYYEDSNIEEDIKEIKSILKGKAETDKDGPDSGIKDDLEYIRSRISSLWCLMMIMIFWVFVSRSCSVSARLDDKQVDEIASKVKIAVMEDINASKETKK